MGSVLEALEQREAVALERVEELRAEALSAADRLDAARLELSNLVIARLTVAEVLAGATGADVPPVSRGGSRRGGAGGSVRDTAVYERIKLVFAGAGGPLSCRQVCDELGLPEGRNTTESVRAKLKRLVGEGVLAVAGLGSFVLAEGTQVVR